LREEVEGGSICNFAAAIVKAAVEVEVKVGVLEMFPSSQLTSLSVFSGCQSSVGASFSQAEVSIRGCCRGVEVAVEVFKAAIEVLRPPSRCRGCR
jgi:hypothetical protein